MDDVEGLLFDVREGVATVTLNRPEKLNAITWEMVNGLTRFVAIRKVREGDFDASTREFEISSKGVLVKDPARPPS